MTATGRRLTAAALFGLAAAALYLLFVRTTTGQILDNAAMEGAPEKPWWIPNHAAHTVTQVVSIAVIVAVVGVALWCLRPGPPGRAPAAMVVLLAPVAVDEVLKHLVLSRPELVAGVGDQHYLRINTWPSGHVSAACAAAIVVVLLAPAARRRLVALVAAAGAATAALALLWAEAHRPSDEMAAALVAGAIALLVVAARPGAARPTDPARAGLGAPGRVLAVVAAVGAGASAIGLPLLLPLTSHAGFADHDHTWVRLVAAPALAGTIALVIAVVGWLAPPDWVAGPRTSDRDRTVRRADGSAAAAPYVAGRADEGSAACAEQLSSPVQAGDSGEPSPSGWRPTAGT
jgi:hypothetical protein